MTQQLNYLVFIQGIQVCCFKGAHAPMFIAALSTIAKVWKEPKCPLADEWIRKIWYIYNGVLLSNQKERNLAICNYMDGTRGYYAKQN